MIITVDVEENLGCAAARHMIPPQCTLRHVLHERQRQLSVCREYSHSAQVQNLCKTREGGRVQVQNLCKTEEGGRVELQDLCKTREGGRSQAQNLCKTEEEVLDVTF